MESTNSPEGFKRFMNRFVLRNKDNFVGKTIVDLPAGNGETSKILKDVGAKVLCFDLFPEFFNVDGLQCRRVNIMEGIPLQDSSVDIVFCQEGIEHFSDQIKSLREFNRILKKNGTLLLTTPNYSNLRAKVSYLLSESERFNSLMPPNELDSIWMSNTQISKEIYFGHIFLLGIQKLRVMAKVSGFKIRNIHFESVKPTSLILFPFLYPFILLSNWITYRINLRKKTQYPREVKKSVYGEVFRLSINPKILLDGTLFIEFEKELETDEVAHNLIGKLSSFDIKT